MRPVDAVTTTVGAAYERYLKFYQFDDVANCARQTASGSDLPPGVTVGTSSGKLSGTPNAAGIYHPKVAMTCRLAGIDQAATGTFVWTVNDVITLTSPGPQATKLGELVSLPVRASSLDSANVLTIGEAGLPTGLAYNPATKRIEGTPTTPGVFTATLTASGLATKPVDATTSVTTATFDWTVGETLPPGLYSVAPGTDRTDTVDQEPSGKFQLINAAGDVLCDVGKTVSYDPLTLPPGVRIGYYSGSISGTTTTAGVYPVEVSVTCDRTPGVPKGTAAFTWTVNDVITLTAPDSRVDFAGYPVARPIRVATLDRENQVTVSVTGLPTGIEHNAASGLMEGTPSTPGKWTVNITVESAVGKPIDTDKSVTAATFTWEVKAPAVTVESVPDQKNWVGDRVRVPVKADVVPQCSGGCADPCQDPCNDPCPGAPGPVCDQLHYSADGLPPGVRIDPVTGVMSGTTTTKGEYDVSVTVCSTILPESCATRTFHWSVLDRTTPTPPTPTPTDPSARPAPGPGSDSGEGSGPLAYTGAGAGLALAAAALLCLGATLLPIRRSRRT